TDGGRTVFRTRLRPSERPPFEQPYSASARASGLTRGVRMPMSAVIIRLSRSNVANLGARPGGSCDRVAHHPRLERGPGYGDDPVVGTLADRAIRSPGVANRELSAAGAQHRIRVALDQAVLADGRAFGESDDRVPAIRGLLDRCEVSRRQVASIA